MTTFRHGCCRAARRAHRPGADLLLDPGVIVRQLLELPAAQPIDAAVADVRDARADDAPASSADAVVAMPRSSLESAIAEAIFRLARRKAALRRLASRLSAGFERKGPGAVLVGAAPYR